MIRPVRPSSFATNPSRPPGLPGADAGSSEPLPSTMAAPNVEPATYTASPGPVLAMAVGSSARSEPICFTQSSSPVLPSCFVTQTSPLPMNDPSATSPNVWPHAKTAEPDAVEATAATVSDFSEPICRVHRCLPSSPEKAPSHASPIPKCRW